MPVQRLSGYQVIQIVGANDNNDQKEKCPQERKHGDCGHPGGTSGGQETDAHSGERHQEQEFDQQQRVERSPNELPQPNRPNSRICPKHWLFPETSEQEKHREKSKIDSRTCDQLTATGWGLLFC